MGRFLNSATSICNTKYYIVLQSGGFEKRTRASTARQGLSLWESFGLSKGALIGYTWDMNEFCYQRQQEETVWFDLPGTEGLRIKGILRGSFEQPLAVIMHGRPGTGNELLPYLAARYLFEQGIASLRLFMYDFEPNTRNLLDSSLETNAHDFDVVVEQLRKRNVPKIYGIGHSYGGITILKARARLDCAVLWDPTHGSYWSEHLEEDDKDYPETIAGEIVVGTAGDGYIDSVTAREYDKHLGDTTAWAAHKGYPLKVISAGKGAMAHLGKRYIAVADEPKQHVVIEDAHHPLDDSDEVVLELFQETASWLKKF